MVEARTVLGKAGIWRSGAMTCARSATSWASASPIVLGVSFGGMVALAYATRHPAHPCKLVLISTEAAGGTHRDRRVALFERFGGPEVGALARRRFLEVQGHPDQASLDAWRRLAFPLYAASRAIRTWRAVRSAGRRCCIGSQDRAAKATRSTCSRILAASSCPTLVLGGEGRSDPPDREPGGYRSRAAARISCSSNDLPIAGTPSSLTRRNARWR